MARLQENRVGARRNLRNREGQACGASGTDHDPWVWRAAGGSIIVETDQCQRCVHHICAAQGDLIATRIARLWIYDCHARRILARTGRAARRRRISCPALGRGLAPMHKRQEE